MKTKAVVEVLQDDDVAEDATDATTEDAAQDGGTDEQGEQPETPADDQAEPTSEATDEAPADDTALQVTFGEAAPASEDDENRAPEWVRELRKQNRELIRENRELRAKHTDAAPSATVVGKKPTLEACDYDESKFETELEAWHARKRKAEGEDEARRKAEEAEAAAWQAKLDAYGKRKSELKVRDFDDAEEQVKASFNVTQQGVLLQGSDNPALLVYALGKNPNKAKELAAITDPVKFAFAVAKLETQLKVTPKKATPLPEKPIRGSAAVTGAVDSNLERLRAEAERTGDFTKVFAYKQQQRAKRAA
jgi:hypothetical protein